jgi:hypothetical protein
MIEYLRGLIFKRQKVQHAVAAISEILKKLKAIEADHLNLGRELDKTASNLILKARDAHLESEKAARIHQKLTELLS